jgi:hypothetical protein
LSALHRRAAVSTRVLRTVGRSNVERLMALRTSEVATCCSSASSRSRVSRATSVSRLAVEVLRGCPAFGPTRLLRATAFGACAFGDLPPALECRRIVAPRLSTSHQPSTLEGPWGSPINVAFGSTSAELRGESDTRNCISIATANPKGCRLLSTNRQRSRPPATTDSRRRYAFGKVRREPGVERLNSCVTPDYIRSVLAPYRSQKGFWISLKISVRVIPMSAKSRSSSRSSSWRERTRCHQSVNTACKLLQHARKRSMSSDIMARGVSGQANF